jgi:hypothetical protein
MILFFFISSWANTEIIFYKNKTRNTMIIIILQTITVQIKFNCIAADITTNNMF